MRWIVILCSLVLSTSLACSTPEDSGCLPGQRSCPGGCANVMTDSQNCGACSRPCPTGQVCQTGTCGAACPTGQQLCSGTCVDTRYNPAHCGSCGSACATGQHCDGGTCVGGCPAGQTNCSGTCADLRESRTNCGSCGNDCPDGPCFEGACTTGCPVGFTECSGRCVDLQKDEENCGSCDAACATGEMCNAGDCGLTCPEGYTACTGVCVILASDHGNCGTCGHACAAGEVCTAADCSTGGCPTGLVDCSGSCVDTDNNPAHCGSCTNVCPSGEACTAGSCGVLCPTGQEDCYGSCVTLDIDPMNCGSCGNDCRMDQECWLGTCDCPYPREECSGACVDYRSDPANCGSCGNACTGAEACDGSSCTVDCPSGTEACGGYCVDTLSDRNHCGECDFPCGYGESCAGGTCVSSTVPGDTCSSTIDVSWGGQYGGTITGAGADYAGSCGGTSGRDIVFTYSLTETTDVFINTFNSSVDTVVYVRRTCGGTGTDIACNDDSRTTLQSELRLLDQPAGTYYLYLDTYSSYSTGAYSLDIYFSAPSSLGGDACGEPTWVDIGTATPFTLTGNTCPWYWINARDDDVACSRGTGGRDFVYYFIVSTSGSYTFNTCGGGTTWDSILDLRSVCDDPDTSARVACNDDSCSTQSSITATLDPGVYYLWLDGYNAGACGGYTINVTR